MMWTNENLMSQIALAMSSDASLDDHLPLGPSSTIVLEFTQDEGAEDLTVHTYINDQLVKTTACDNKDSCSATKFAQALGTALDEANLNVSNICSGTGKK